MRPGAVVLEEGIVDDDAAFVEDADFDGFEERVGEAQQIIAIDQVEIPEVGGEVIAEAKEEITRLKAELDEARQDPFELYGLKALDFYHGIEDPELRVSLMKLWCWGEEAKRLGLMLEYGRIQIVQVERLAYTVYLRVKLGALFTNMDALHLACKAVSNYGIPDYDRHRICRMFDLPYERYDVERSKGKASVETMIVILLTVGRVSTNMSNKDMAQRVKDLISIRNNASHHSISDATFSDILKKLQPGSPPFNELPRFTEAFVHLLGASLAAYKYIQDFTLGK